MISTSQKVMSIDTLRKQLAMWKFQSDQIVFTNGCFDILHAGHITYLEQAASLGERLVIGLNSDESVKRLKGMSRPIMPHYDRALLLAALHCTDAIILFNEDTPENIIHQITPDILTKGGDYQINQIVGADFVKSYGGQVQTIPFVNGYSTSAIIDKICKI